MAEIRVNATGELKLYDSDDSNYVSFKSAGTVSSNVAWVLPSADGSSGQALTTNGSGTLSWADAGSADPSSADGDSLGTASAEWSDLYLADGGIVYFGNDQDIRLTHNADKGLILKHSATADDKPVILTLQTGETDIAQDDVLGKIEFQAPDEGTGTDAVLVAAAIQAVSEGDFSSSSNATSLQFMTGASEAAAEKMTLTSGGILNAGKIGVIGDHDLGEGIHIKLGDSGASVDNDADALVIEDTHGVGMTLLGGNDDEMSIHFGDAQDANNGYIKYHHNYGYLSFGTNASEQLRIKEGNDNHFYTFDSTQTTEASYVMYIMSDKTEGNSANRMIGFDNSSQGRGYIVAGDGDSDPPSFAAGSDRRLKENITNYTGGYDKIKSIPVKQWDEKYSSKKKGKVGWIADELDDVFPIAVSGTPNATKDVKNSILDKDGRCVIESVNKEFLDKKQADGKWSDCTFHETATVPDYQYSSPLKFFPDVVQALQASITKIETLETKVKALEG